MPLVAQVTGAVALTALIVGPWWASAPEAIPQTSMDGSTPPATQVATAPAATPPSPAPAVAPVEVAPAPPAPPARPAHLNLDVRHSFKSVNFSVTVDDKPMLHTRLEGSGKRFGVFGKRSERGYTRTLDLAPGAHLVRVRVLSQEEKFDQTRVERFDLGSASVATIRISVDKSGLSLVAERPPAPPPSAVAELPRVTPPPAPPAPIQAASIAVPQATTATRQDVNAVADLLQSVRSMLIWIAGFVATTATAFVLEEWLKTRKEVLLRSREGARATLGRRRRIQDAIDIP